MTHPDIDALLEGACFPDAETREAVIARVSALVNASPMECGKRNGTDFGSYVHIEQKRYSVKNEMYLYKVVKGGVLSNTWVDVPVQAGKGETLHDSMTPVVLCICCGIDETKVERFRVSDVRPLQPLPKGPANE